MLELLLTCYIMSSIIYLARMN